MTHMPSLTVENSLKAALQTTIRTGNDWVSTGELAAPLEECRSRINELLVTAGAGARIRDGMRLVILGPPNAGKSTLFNTLCGAERAIVSPHPGTTRDVIEAELDIGGIRIIVQDTAGLRMDAWLEGGK